MKVGDLVKVDYVSADSRYKWNGICTWSDGYKFEFLIDGEFDTWTGADLGVMGAVVVNESR